MKLRTNKLLHFKKNAKEFGVQLFDMGSVEQGIVHMVGQKQVSLNLEKQSFVVIHILPRMGPLVQSHLV